MIEQVIVAGIIIAGIWMSPFRPKNGVAQALVILVVILIVAAGGICIGGDSGYTAAGGGDYGIPSD